MTDEPKKDLTGLMEYADALKLSGIAPEAPKGLVLEEQKIEKVDDFESLDDFSKSHPAAEAPALEVSGLPGEDAFATTPSPDAPPLGDVPALDFVPANEEAQAGSNAAPTIEGLPSLDSLPPIEGISAEATFSPGGDDLSAMKFAQTQGQAPPATEPPPVPHEVPLQELHAADGAINLSSINVLASNPAADGEGPLIAEPLRPARKTAAAELQPMEKVRQYSEQLSPGSELVPAAFPFSLMITGQLAPEEKERLVDILTRENMGFREFDLDPQFQEGKILIPRISEYAGVLIVSALRSTRATIRLGPSDSIYATVDTRDSTEEAVSNSDNEIETYHAESMHSAEDLPITTDDHLPGAVQHAVLDIVTASAGLKTMTVQAESSPEYQRILEALSRELKYKAFLKGATGITNFSVQLTQLHMPMHYRVMVTGSAIKPS